MLYAGYRSDTIESNDTDNVTLASDDQVTENTAKIMQSILKEEEKKICVIM